MCVGVEWGLFKMQIPGFHCRKSDFVGLGKDTRNLHFTIQTCKETRSLWAKRLNT